jgi:tetratricopeptide (TPR) repeat protein
MVPIAKPDKLPIGTITFLFTDIEGSTIALQALGDEAFADVLAVHNKIMSECAETGVLVRTMGDGLFAAFVDPIAAVSAAISALRRLHTEEWPANAKVRVRMGLHTGVGILGGDDYVGLDVHRAARIADAGHGEQIVVSASTAALIEGHLPEGSALRAAREPYQEALVLLRMHGDPTQIANALYNLSFPVTYMGATGQAIDYLTESPSIAEDIDDRLGIGRAYWGFCFVATMAKDYEDTIPHAERAAAEFELLDSPFDLGWTRFMLAQTHYLLGNSDGARQYVDMAIPLFVTTRDLAAVVLSLYLNVAITISEGDENRAALMLGAAKTLKLRTGATIADVEQNQYEDVTTLMNDSRTGIQEAIEAGRRMTTEQAMALAATV